jgi:hypothetical protein
MSGGREAIAIIGNGPDNLWDWIALAQHHRLPTRLLDWTKNPLAGLWFAVREGDKETTCPGVVWVLKPEDADIVRDVSGNPSRFERSPSARSPLLVEKTMVFEPRHVTPRIRAQAGMVTIHRCIDGELTTPLEKDPDYLNRLTKVSVPADHFDELRAHLLNCGVHDGSLFPDLDGLASRNTNGGGLKTPQSTGGLNNLAVASSEAPHVFKRPDRTESSNRSHTGRTRKRQNRIAGRTHGKPSP